MENALGKSRGNVIVPGMKSWAKIRKDLGLAPSLFLCQGFSDRSSEISG